MLSKTASLSLALALACGSLLFSAPPVAAQSGPVVISSPAQDERVQGIVTILGSASDPAFVKYEISFGFDPNPTDTWFPLGQPAETPVTGGALAAWDTTGIADGVYMLRLQVFTAETDAPLEFITRGIRVQNSTPTPSPTPPPATATPVPSPTSPVVLPPTATTQPTATDAPAATDAATPSADGNQPGDDIAARLSLNAYTAAFCRGMLWAFGAFFMLWLYARLRALVRPRLRRWLRRTLSDLRRP